MLGEKIEAVISKNQMQNLYTGAILGFSGGADSSALLHFLKDKTKNLLCVHINHMIRGDEASRDEDFARKICQGYGVKFLSYKIDIPKLAGERKKGLEETAREERYKVFNSLLEKNPEYKCIITAHNLDDNLETVIFNLARGTGPQGLIGIKAVQGNIMRPLITSSKKEILEYCSQNNIPYVSDSTNDDTVYTRNHIRHNIIPALEKINPEVRTSALRLGDILEGDEEYFNNIADKIIKENQIKDKIDLKLFNSLERPIKSRLLRRVLGGALDFVSSQACIELAKKCVVGSLVNLPNGISFKIERDYVHFIKTSALEYNDYCVELQNGINKIDEIDKIIALDCDTVPNGYTLECEASLNREKITGRLYARAKKDGDRIRSGKMTKKLKSLFVEKHIPSHLRAKIPLILMDNEIILVPNIAVRDEMKGKDFKIKIYIKSEGENE